MGIRVQQAPPLGLVTPLHFLLSYLLRFVFYNPVVLLEPVLNTPLVAQGAQVRTSEAGLSLEVFRRFFRAKTLVRLGGSDNGRDLAQTLTDLR